MLSEHSGKEARTGLSASASVAGANVITRAARRAGSNAGLNKSDLRGWPIESVPCGKTQPEIPVISAWGSGRYQFVNNAKRPAVPSAGRDFRANSAVI